MNRNLRQYSYWIFLSTVIGLLAGFSASIFLILLELATKAREQNLNFIYFLPVAGFLIGLLYHHYGKGAERGNNLILDEIHNPKKIIPFRMTPFVLLGSVLTHLTGGSAGREGAIVQMGASLADQLPKFFKIKKEERKILLVAGVGAGFGAGIGTPIAGIIFGMEVLYVGRLKLFAFAECTVASFTAYYVTRFLHAPHTVYTHIAVPKITFLSVFSTLAAGAAFGLAVLSFITLTHVIEKTYRKLISFNPLKPLIGGVILVLFYHLEGSYRYTGLGIPLIKDAMIFQSSLRDPVFKLLFSAITIGSGFKGGEFIPLVFIGTTLGSFLSTLIFGGAGFLSALGFAAVFAGAANTPIACTVMAMEIFGYKIGFFAMLACFTSYYLSGHHSIYSTQPIGKRIKLRQVTFFR